MMHRLGARRLVVVGVPPLGCMPLVKTIVGEAKCVDNFNKAIFSFNFKINAQMATLRATLGLKCAFVDIYGVMQSAINNPKRYGQYIMQIFHLRLIFFSLCFSLFYQK